MNHLDVRGARIRVHETGDPAAPPVLLLHGIGRSLEDWSLQHPRLDTDYRVISMDMPGFGLSQRMPEPTTLRVLADGVWATLDALGETRPVHLMGNSLGGAVSMTMLAGTPERVATLTLVNSAGFGREVTWALRLLALPGVGRQMLRRIDRRTAPRVERTLFRDRALVTPERVAMAIRIARQPDFAAVYLEIAKELGGFRGVAPAWRSTLLAALAELARPTMILWGDRDLILPSTHLAAARAAFPHARSHMFADTGHMPQIERPDEFARLVRPMLAEVPV
ncbi:alpha/beta fold hydrolase [Actinoplanes teichomyceticus]|uniref:Pimeloyl-ACP methyl ester carboxylesterase n=1 Tax=Actinoplanes teichomyceticus TaxID=1867 RepID=A0A561WLD2_ACTTI|nr:alpha/beta fold hydrolase [Actinoplanes teichomyceticus]TWG24653.1 pimeloyl-ACP methyl ester carboxylesterase [Actinoplanes teichomyceticus]GIF14684.1 alpha/beta hydrolase [Actinoplanes teichomyceticus]